MAGMLSYTYRCTGCGRTFTRSTLGTFVASRHYMQPGTPVVCPGTGKAMVLVR